MKTNHIPYVLWWLAVAMGAVTTAIGFWLARP